MKPFLRILLASALALLSGATAFAAASSAPSGITSTPGSAAPNEVVSLSVTLTNSAAATTAPTNQNDFPAGGSANVTFTFTHTVTGFSFTRTGTVSTTSAIAENGGTGVLSGNFTIPTVTTQAGAYRASVVINSVSSGTFSGSSYAAPGTTLTITGKPDLKITNITYPAGTAYRGGDVIPMTLSYTNLTSSNGGYNVPYVPGVNGDSTFFRIEVILSSNPTFGDGDDFLLTSHDVSTSPFNADSADTTVSWNQILPGNFAGTYYVMAKIDALSGVSESIDNDLTLNGNNTWFSPDTNAARISLLPTNFPTVYWASTAGNAYSDNPAITADGRYTAFASDSTTLGTGDTNVIRDIFLYDNQTASVRRLSLSQQGAQSNGASNNPAISANGTYIAFSSDATNLALDDTNGFSDIYVVNALTGVITRVSLSTAGVQANGSNFKPAISATGRYVAWESNATNLIVAGTAVGVTHIYLRDRDVSGSGTFDTAGNVSTVLISQSSGSAAGDGNSIQASISGGGRYVAFASDATNLVAGDTNALRDVFVRDVTGGTTTRVSVATGGTESAGGASRAPSINQNNGSADDGRYVAFGSEATNLVAGDTNAVSDVFVHDRNSTTTTRVSVSSAGVEAIDPSSTAAQRLGSVNPSISSTGRYVAFASLASNLTAGDSAGRSQTNDSNSSVDIFVIDRDVNASGTFDTGGNIATTMVSKNRFGYQTSGLLGTPSTAASDLYPVISANGRWVAFPSDAENTAGLVHSATNRSSPDSNTFRDVFLHDRRINALPSATTPPSVSITSPVTATSYPVNSAITVVGSASAPAGTITSVQFFVNGTSLGTDTSFPYNATWTPTAVGSFALSALVTDSFGNQATSANVSITIAAVSPTSPTVSISSPANGASLFANGPTTVSASATDSDGTIASVQFFANGVSIGTDSTFPYSVQFTPVATGSYTLTAVATDNGGNQTTTTGAGSPSVTVTNLSAPSISITSPSPVQINSATTITATTTTAGSIASVQFLANGTTLGTVTSAPFTFNWTPTAAGAYTLSAVATDNLGSQTTSANISVTVSAGASPTVSISSPTAGTVNVNTPQTVTATAADADGTVASVQFSVNGIALGGPITAFPFTTTWTPTTSGTYTLLAVATDNLGNQTTSSSVSMTVTSGTAPTGVAVTAPATLAVGSAASLTATATANVGTIANVQFLVNGEVVATDTTFPYAATFTPLATGSYSVTAIATDTVGNQTTSAAVTLVVSANTAPTGVAITAPTAGDNINVGTATTLTATATDADGSVASVQFFANGTSVGTVTSSPYSLSWTPGVAGSYNLTAVATDNLGATTTSTAVAVTAGGTNAPTGVAISAPAAGTRPIGSAITVSGAATASGGRTISNLQFFANGVSLGTDNTFPYAVTWTPTALGSYSLTVTATDSAGNTATSASVVVTVVANTAPTVALTAPANGATIGVGSATALTATASDTEGTIASVQFFANGTSLGTDTTSPYTSTFTPTVAGTYSLTAVATDDLGLTTTSTAVSVTVTGGNAPTVSVTAPANASLLAVGSSATVTADATAATGTIASVQFFANGVSLGTDTTVPYSVTWAPVANGTYSLTALAIDTAGNQATSSAVSVTVAANAAPTISIGSPVNAATVPVGTATTITATAGDTDGTIAGVQFFVNGGLIGTDTTSPYSVSWTPTINGSYTLTATATDNSGAATTSASVGVTAGGGNAPTVSLTAPLAGPVAVGSANTVTALANATLSGTSIAGVQFFANGAAIGTASAFPHTITWTPIVNGTYALTAVATDTAGNQATSASVSVTVAANQLPSVALTAPANGATVGVGTGTSLTATASDNDGTVARVQFFVTPSGGTAVSVGTSTTAPHSATWTPTTSGTYTVTAVATDNVGGTTTSTAATVTVSGGLAPLVTLTSPGANIANGTVVTLTATATAATGTIASVQFFANGTSLGTDTTFPYTATWTPTANGNISLTALATDTAGNQTTSAAVVVAVAANVAPTITVTAPASVGVGSANTLTATPSDTDGTITSVQFFANGTSLGTDTTSPYSVTWTPSVAGSYSITAVATDNLGATTTSATSSVTVTSGVAPVVTVTAPNAAAAVNSTVALTATATATAPATIANVQFFANSVLIGTTTTFPYTVNWTPTAIGTYSLTALATDSSGNQATSATVTVTVGTNQTPTVSVTAPVTLGVGVAGTITATAADVDGTIASVQFFANGTAIGAADTTAPYSVSFTSTIAGAIVITAVATDNLGATTTSAPATITVSGGNAPSVSLTAPGAGTVSVNVEQTLTATATAATGAIANVVFRVATGGGTPVVLGTDATFPYTATWTPTATGTYSLTALATDTAGNQTVSTAVAMVVAIGSAPTVSIVNPNTGGTYIASKEILFDATASDSDGTIARVELIANGVIVATDTNSPYFTNWSPASPGSYSLIARATDNSGNTTDSAPVSITVTQNTPPIINLVSPAAGSTFTLGSNVVFFATAADANGTINNVRFLANGDIIGAADTAAPYSTLWTPAATGTYAVLAIGVDNDLNASTGAPRNVTIAAAVGNTPTVVLTSPADSSPLTTASTFPLIAAAADSGGTVTQVEFFDNGASLGTDTTAPYTLNWSPLVAGSHRLFAVATDNDGNVIVSAPVDLTVNPARSAAPTVALTNPGAQTLGTPVNLLVTAADSDGTVSSVAFYDDGLLIGTDNSAPFSLSWTPNRSGTHILTALATDNTDNKVISAAVSVAVAAGAAPTVAITAPGAGANIAVNSTRTITATATANTGTIASVQFYANGVALGGADTTFPYETTWTPTAEGSYSLTAIAVDTAGNQASSSVISVTVAANAAPTVAITAPAAGALGVGVSTTVTAAPTDSDGTVASVQFFANGVSLGTDTTAPYTATFVSNVGGTFNLTAVATDNLGATGTSAVVAMTVTGGNAPAVNITAPLTGTAVAAGSTNTVAATATATLAGATIARVEFFANGTSLGIDTSFPYSVTWNPVANGSYSLTAVATDSSGNQATSGAVTVTVAANAAPTGVAITSPAAAAVLPIGSVATITATANDGDGSIASVQFFVATGTGGTPVSLGTDTTAPYSATFTPTSAATHVLTAVATDNLGATTTSPAITVTSAAGSVPVVTVSGPAAAAVNSTVALTATATATAPATIASVQFFANGIAVGGADTTFPYAASWIPTATGTYAITALAIDSAGNQATSSAVAVSVGANQLPTVSVTAPANAASVGVGSVNTVTATAADNDGSVVSVQFFANGTSLGTDTTSPFTASWTPTIAGTYALTAVATDNLGATATSTTNTVTVAGGNAPTISVTAPANGSAIAVNTTNTVTATASATLAGATITRVEFFANGVSLGTDTTFPYAATWTPTALGTYAITALATDSSGNQSTSTANSVTVSTAGAGPAPSVSLTSPNSGATYVVGQPVTMGATVGLGSSFITGVQFFVNGISIGGGSTPPNGQGAAPFWTASWTPAAPGSYTFTAVVTDANGVQVTSAPITITVSAITVPTIVIASPSNATSLAPNLAQTLVANVGVTNASVLNVQFFANNVSLGTVSTFPYSVNWTPATTGDYSVIAVLTTSTGVAVTSAPRVYSVATGTVPTVSVTTPLPAATVNVGFPQNIVATAAATQAGAVIRDVQFFVNGVSIGTDATFPFGATWTPLVPGAYSITSVATDTLGNRQTSTAVSVTATAVSTTAPSVNIVTPANLATVSIGTSPAPVVTITANATDPDGTIASVQFFANGLSLGTINAFPYTISWTPTAEGTYSLTAVAIDNGGNQSTSAAVTVTASAAGAPTVTLSTSATGNTSTANSPVTLTANAVAAFGRNVTSVQFFANGTAIGAADTVSPYSTTWTPLAPGVYAITATATDNLNVSGTSAATNVTITSGTPPSISITSPGNGSTIAVSTVQTFTATATPVAPATITNVQFLVNGVSIGNDNSSPYSVSYTPLSLGAYTLTAVATDSLTNTTTSTAVNFTVVAAVGPTVAITAPTNGTSGNVGSPVTVSANPTSGGTITSVQFFANGVSIGTDTTAPYSVSWIPTAGGPVNLTAVATDSSNVTGAISTPATYTVLTPPATVSITGPGAGVTLPVNVPQTIFASATVTNGTVVSVQFFVNGVSVGTDNTFPFSAPWTPTTTGTFALTAKSTDNFGTVTDSGTTTGVVTVTVTGGTAPSVSLSSPANNSTLSVGLPQTLVANATAVNGTIANVRFLANSVVLGTDNTFPYNLSWTPTAVGTYEIIVVATDTLGNETRSAVSTLTVAPVSAGAPAVSLTAPAAGASLPVGVTTLLAANATDPDGNIVSVEFLSNGVSLGTDTVFPYNISFTPGATGTYVLTAIATDNGGNITTSTAVTVTVTGGTAPSVAIDGPANGVTLGVNAPQTITATATSTTGFIKDVQFFLNGQPLSTDSSYPYAAEWNPSAIGTYTLTARATDNLGNITDSAPVVVTIGASAAPTVSVTNPPNGSSYTVGAALNLTADAADSDGTITGVQFFVNGLAQGGIDSVSPYTGTWTPGSVGVYTLTARATDNNGNVTTSAPVTVTIGANAAPTVALTSPAAGTYSLGNLVLVSASANDSDGTVASVQFFANGLSIGTSTAAPFNTSWRPTLAGTFRLTAVATDNAGNVTTSSVVSVTITSTAAPAVTIMNPIVGQPYGVGNAIPFTANPTGGNGPISQVQFFVNGTSVGVDSTSPYASTFTPNAPGTYSLLAIATDSAGLSSSSSASINIVVTGNSAPAVAITSPPSGTSVNGGTIVNLTAIATDTDGTVASVRFLANGNQVGTAATSIPFGTAWIPSAAGTYSVTAQATDNSGNVTNSAPISVTVVANAVPTVTLTSPANGATVRVGSGTTLAATAADTDGTIASVQFFANGLSIGTDTTSPYSTAWTPGAEGIYRITAVALDNSGAATTSGTVLALAVSATSGGTDTVYTGTYAGSGEIGRFATISIRGKSAAFIGFSQTQPAKIYFYDSLAVDLGGGFFLPDSLGRAIISGSVSDTGVSGTLDAGRINFIGPVTFPSATATVASGLYTGNLTDRAGSLLAAIVGPDGSIFLYATDGANFRDAGAGAVNSTGGFTVTTSSGNRFSGRADPATGFLTGTLTGGPGGTFTAAIASGVSFSDGFLRNLSTRGPVGTGNDVLVAGFAVAGNTPKRVLIRAIGPSLAAFGIAGALADTRLDLFNGNTLVVANDNWGGAGEVIAASTAVGAFPLATTSLDSVVVATLPPGLYTAQVSGVGGRTGVALVELYDLDTLQAFSTQKLTNVATRGVLTAAQNQIIAGFMVSGTTSKKVLVRAVGPTLGRAPFNVPGTLADPMLRLVRGDGSVVRENDNWETGNDAALISEASAKVGAFALSAGAKDCAILINLPPGTYSAQVNGAAPGTGTVLVEVYEVP